MERRKFVIGAGALLTGSTAAIGTGAISEMSSGGRSVTVQVVDDSSAYVQLEPAGSRDEDNMNGHYAEQTGDTLEIDVADAPNAFGDGVNPDSTYYIDNVFTIGNDTDNGSAGGGPNDTLEFWISKNTANRVSFYWGGDPSDGAQGPNNKRGANPSDGVTVGLAIDASGLDSSDTISGQVEISAESSAN
jgi:hypothetical protein